MGDVADAEGDGIGVHAGIRERQGLGIAAHPFDVRFASLAGAHHAFGQHVGIDVADGDLSLAAAHARELRDAESDVAGAAGHIQHLPAGPRVQPFDHGVLPQPVDARAHQIVHEVVFARDRGKDLAHQGFLLGFRHLAEAEGRGFGTSCSWWPDNSLWPGSGLPSRPPTLNSPAMPELPEVETVRTGLEPALKGHRLTRVETRRGDLRIPFPAGFVQHLTGRKVTGLRRRAKYILADLDNGTTLVMHLGMSGRMTVYARGHAIALDGIEDESVPSEEGNGPHDHVVFETDAGARIVFTDHRRFGLMTILDTDKLGEDKLFKGLGPEPLDKSFNAEVLAAALKGKKTSIKAALLDQRVVAGIGNIYACEALFRAHLSPRRKASTISGERAKALVAAIKDVLRDAIKAGGSTLRDYKKSDGGMGYFQHRFEVYDREGEPCPAKGCKGTIRRIVQTGRSTFYCPSCQK